VGTGTALVEAAKQMFLALILFSSPVLGAFYLSFTFIYEKEIVS
jgi:hypothetical protein